MSQHITINILGSEAAPTMGTERNQEQLYQDSLPTPMQFLDMEGGETLGVESAPTPFDMIEGAEESEQSGIPSPGSSGEEGVHSYGIMSGLSEAEPTPFDISQVTLSGGEDAPEPELFLEVPSQDEPAPEEDHDPKGSSRKTAKGKK